MAAGHVDWMAQTQAITANAQANLEEYKRQAQEQEVRTNNDIDTMMQNFISMNNATAKAAQQRDVDSAAAGSRMDGFSSSLNAMSAGMFELSKLLTALSAKFDDRPSPQIIPRTEGNSSVAEAAAAIEAAGSHTQTGA